MQYLKVFVEAESQVPRPQGNLSEQLISMKEKRMSILKEFITKHNAPNDVPNELVESSLEEDTETIEKTHVKSKKTKLT
ncbi:hypothetical protein I3760_03G110500 [Carya illinoinensis]|nr:hypothetical protein I3760_03G110500 [Carya illinoinensis]